MIKVIISRRIENGMDSTYEQAAQEIFQAMVGEPGYVSGESLKEVGKESHRIIVTQWHTVKDWQTWYSSTKRRQAIFAVQATLQGAEHITILTH